jgi:hypothetical protein
MHLEARTELRGSFPWLGREGNVYVLEHFVITPIATVSRKRHDGAGQPQPRCNGHRVSHLGKGRYRAWSGIELSTDAPAAP